MGLMYGLFNTKVTINPNVIRNIGDTEHGVVLYNNHYTWVHVASSLDPTSPSYSF